MANPPNPVQRVWGVFSAITGGLLGLTTSGEFPYYPINGSFATFASVAAAGGVRLQTKAVVTTVVAACYATLGDQGGGIYQYNPTDVTSGCAFTGSISGTALTVASVQSGALAVGLLVSRQDTGATVGSIVSGTFPNYVLSASSPATAGNIPLAADNGNTILVGFDGGRWYLVSGNGGPIAAEIANGVTPSAFQYSVGNGINLLRYGIDTTGTNDNTTLVNNAIAVAGSSGDNKIIFPAGVFVLGTSATVTVNYSVSIVGQGQVSSIVKPGAAANVIFSVTTSNVVFSGLGFNFGPTQTAGSVYIYFASGSGICYVELCSFNAWYTAIKLDGGNLQTIRDCFLSDGVPANGTGILVNDQGGTLTIDNVTCTNPASIATAPYAALYLAGGGNVNVNTINCQFLWCLYGVAIQPGSGNVVASAQFVNVYCDHCVNRGALLQPASGGAIVRLVFDTCWFGSTQGQSSPSVTPVGLLATTGGGGTIDGVMVIDCQFALNASVISGPGAWFTGSGTKNINVTGGWSAGNSSGLVIDTTTQDVSVVGHRSGAVGSITGNTSYGIQIVTVGAAQAIAVHDCDLTGNGVAAMQDNSTGGNKAFSGILPVPASISVSVGSSPFTFTNTTGFPIVMTISGNAITGAVLNGVTVATATNVSIVVPNNFALVTSYSGSAPTMEYIPIN